MIVMTKQIAMQIVSNPRNYSSEVKLIAMNYLANYAMKGN